MKDFFKRIGELNDDSRMVLNDIYEALANDLADKTGAPVDEAKQHIMDLHAAGLAKITVDKSKLGRIHFRLVPVQPEEFFASMDEARDG